MKYLLPLLALTLIGCAQQSDDLGLVGTWKISEEFIADLEKRKHIEPSYYESLIEDTKASRIHIAYENDQLFITYATPHGDVARKVTMKGDNAYIMPSEEEIKAGHKEGGVISIDGDKLHLGENEKNSITYVRTTN